MIDKERQSLVLLNLKKFSPDKFDLDKELELIEQNNIEIVSIGDPGYPANLKEIHDPPEILYVKGRIVPDDFAAVAIVGSRLASLYGRNFAYKLAMEFAYSGITVVSGMARGIDTQAHRGALAAKGRTLAVLGSGIANIYPEENKGLAEEIAKSGAVISEFPMQTPPNRHNFPIRNRTISGLSLGVVVAEAAAKSGSLITADCALDQNREVFAVPGNADSGAHTGANELIKEGAKLITCAQDVIEELAPRLEEYLKKRPQNTDYRPQTIDYRLKDKEAEAELVGEDCKKIYKILTDEKIYIDEIAQRAKLSISDTASALVNLQLKGMAKEYPGKFFTRKKDG